MAVRTAFGLGLYGGTDSSADVWRGLPFTIEELTGRKRRLELYGRALPIAPFELEQNRRGRQTWYPGQQASTDHVLGYDEGSTTIRGSWDTHYLSAADLALYAEGGVVAASVPRRVESAEDLRELMFAIVRAGQRLRVQWAGVERVASVVRFRVAHTTRGRATWEMDFDWSGAGKFVALPVVDAADAGTRSLLDTMGDLLDLAAYPAQLALDVIDYADVQIQRIEGLIGDVRRVLELYTTAATDLLTLGARAVGLMDTIQRTAQNVRQSVLSVPAVAGVGAGSLAGSDASVILRAIHDWLVRTKRVSTDVAAQAARQRDVFAALTRPTVRRVVTVQGDTDLRYIAQQEYGTPDAWPVLADANDLVGSQVSAGTALLVPDRPAAA